MCTSAAIWACMEGIVYGASQEEAIKFVEEYPEHKIVVETNSYNGGLYYF
jgi:tRNA(Arg) A34 adenosine deaminase TadA